MRARRVVLYKLGVLTVAAAGAFLVGALFARGFIHELQRAGVVCG